MARRNHYAVAAAGGVSGGAAGYRLIKDFYKPVKKNIVARINRNTQAVKQIKMEAPNSTTTHAPTTYQHDSKTTYRRRRAPRRVRRMARKSFRTFSKNLSNMLGCKRLINNSFDGSNAAGNAQSVLSLSYFTNGTMSQAFRLFGNDIPENVPPSAAADLFNGGTAASELIFRNFRCETEVKNISTALAWVDLYYWYPRKDCSSDVISYLQQSQGPGTGNNANNAGFFNGAGTLTNQISLSTNLLGVTPFDSPAFTENFVVYRTRRIMLQGGQSFSVDMKLRPGNQSTKDWFGNTLRRSTSRGILIYFCGEVDSNTTTAAVQLRAHTQTWATIAKMGAKGPVSQTYLGTGL